MRDVVLNGENVVERAIVALRPHLGAGGAVDQPGGDPDPVAGAADATLQHVADLQAGAGLDRVTGGLPRGEGGPSTGHLQPGDLRQVGDQVLGDAFAEIVLIRIAAEVLERQDGQGRPGPRRRGLAKGQR